MKQINIGGRQFASDTSKGIYPVFSMILRSRVKKQKAINIAVVGEAGDGKSYIAMQIARSLDSKFDEKQVVFNYKSFLSCVLHLKSKRPIVFDEPSYAMGKRDWYKDLNKALVLTMESFRFKIHPLIIPVINLSLLDKSIRSYLIQYMVYIFDRGKAVVYRLKAKQYEDGYYRYHLSDLQYGMMDRDKCTKKTCLSCRQLKSCNLLRARYERKKASTQDERYEQSLTETEAKMSRELTDKDIEEKLWQYASMFVKNGKVDATLLRIIAQDQLQLKIGFNRSYTIKKAIELHHASDLLNLSET